MLVRYVIILEFCNHPYDYRPNRTPLSPITIINNIYNNIWMAPGENHITAMSTEIFKYVRIHPNFANPTVFFLPCSTGFLISRVSKFSIFQEERRNCVCVGGGGGGGGWKRTSGLFVKSFLPAFRKKQHRNIFSNHTGRLAKFGWILTYLKILVEKSFSARGLGPDKAFAFIGSDAVGTTLRGSTWWRDRRTRINVRPSARPIADERTPPRVSRLTAVIHFPLTSFTCQWRHSLTSDVIHLPVTSSLPSDVAHRRSSVDARPD